MTDTDRKLLTLYLGEIFSPGLFGWPYDHKGKRYSNRTFDNWPDLGALKERLVEKLDYVEFSEYCWDKVWAKLGADIRCEEPMFDGWLYTPTRFCELVAEWLKGRG